MEIAPILARIQEYIPDLSGFVGVSASAQSAVESPSPTRYVWICDVIGSSAANSTINAVVQRHEQNFSVLTVIRNLSDIRGEAALEEMTELRDEIMGALLGFEPDTGYDPIEHVQDRLEIWQDGYMYWRDQFRTAHYLRNTSI